MNLKGVGVAIGLVLFLAISEACPLSRDKRHLQHGLPIPLNMAGECIRSEKSNRKICYPSFDSLDESCLRLTNPSSLIPLLANTRLKAMTFLPPKQYAQITMKVFHQRGQVMPKDVLLPTKSFIFAQFECHKAYELIDEAEYLFCSHGQWSGTFPKCVKKLQ